MRILPAHNASEWTGPTGNSTYLLEGAVSVLIDAGVGHTAHVDAIADALDPSTRAARSGQGLDLVLITHGHVDHASGVPALVARWPDVAIRGGPGRPLEEGELFEAGGTRLRAIHTPGHSPDHFCFLDERTRDVYCGDLVRRGGTVVIPASRGGSLLEYLASLRRIRDLRPARLLPAHGPAVDDPLALIDEYLAHRAERTAQIERLLAEGVDSIDALVARIYPGLSPRLLDAARESVRAHLAARPQHPAHPEHPAP